MKKIVSVLLFALCMVCAVSAFAETSGDYEYTVLENGTAQITKYTGKSSDLSVPAALDGHAVSSIGDKAFDWCSSLKSVTIPDSVTSIWDYAFNYCRSLTSVTIPDSVTSIGANPFESCKLLTKVIVSPEHPTLATIDGVLFSKSDKRLVWYPMTSSAASYSIPQGIMVIGDNAFYSCKSLKSVMIPDSVTSIGEDAFAFCKNLTNVTIPDSVTSIGANPFASCTLLTKVIVSPDHPTLATIDGVLFSKPDKRLVWYPMTSSADSYSIPQGIMVIGDFAFYFCESLTSVMIPDSVTFIGKSAFSFCSSLTSVTIPDSVTSIGDSAFWYCTSLSCVTIPDSVTSIGNSVFGCCKSLTSVTIPDSVTFIGNYAFDNCESLTITVERGSYAAQYCKENNINYTYTDSLDWLTN